ncbi:hypothetical protein AAVH_25636, partial [Aphelenchoides avenae]
MNASALAAKCLEAEAIASSKWFMAVAWIQIVLCASDVALLFVAVRMHLHVKRHFHRSLNIVLFGFVISMLPREVANLATFLSSQIRYWIHTNACSLTTVAWVVLPNRVCRVWYTTVSTGNLASVLLERIYALSYASDYEQRSPIVGALLLVAS